MKVYDYQWATSFGMDAATAAVELVRDGIDTVLVRNQIDPLPTSGVDQEAYLASGCSISVHKDRAWSEALRAAGLRVYQTTAPFFDPELLQSFPDARPIDANGGPNLGFDWYLGVCPTHEGYLEAKIDRLQRVAVELDPDGLFLSFTRYPGFWENWVPGYTFISADRYCFCPRCRARFAADLALHLAPGDAATQARVILEEHGDNWTAWRSRQIVAVIDRIAAAVRAQRPDVEIMLNTLAFPASDFEGLDVRREIAAQDLAMLRGSVDRFELMTYLQILDCPNAWLESVVADARRALPDRPLYSTLQVAPLYTEGIHARRGRALDITAEELDQSARAVLAAGADGLVFYHWTDLLVDEAAGGRKRAVLRGLAGA
ncbi:MAG TPA: hypothetical protein VFY70_08075 [Thermomicrobiales bacterium]|nr:hypothetical protein [Thermomicrobiales bacterium]